MERQCEDLGECAGKTHREVVEASHRHQDGTFFINYSGSEAGQPLLAASSAREIPYNHKEPTTRVVRILSTYSLINHYMDQYLRYLTLAKSRGLDPKQLLVGIGTYGPRMLALERS